MYSIQNVRVCVCMCFKILCTHENPEAFPAPPPQQSQSQRALKGWKDNSRRRRGLARTVVSWSSTLLPSVESRWCSQRHMLQVGWSRMQGRPPGWRRPLMFPLVRPEHPSRYPLSLQHVDAIEARTAISCFIASWTGPALRLSCSPVTPWVITRS